MSLLAKVIRSVTRQRSELQYAARKYVALSELVVYISKYTIDQMKQEREFIQYVRTDGPLYYEFCGIEVRIVDDRTAHIVQLCYRSTGELQ